MIFLAQKCFSFFYLIVTIYQLYGLFTIISFEVIYFLFILISLIANLNEI